MSGSPSAAVELVKPIFTVSTINFNNTKFGLSPRCVGWFPTMEQAHACVRHNWGDIYEGTDSYAVIEETPFGLYPSATEYWYAWAGKGYERCDKPNEASGIMRWAMG